MKYVVNCIFSTQATTGVQSYAFECSKIIKMLFGDGGVFVAPKGKTNQENNNELEIMRGGILRGGAYGSKIAYPYLQSLKNQT